MTTVFFLFSIIYSLSEHFLDRDLLWMIPSVLHYTEGKTFSEILFFLFSPKLWALGAPLVRGFLYFVSSFLGTQNLNYIYFLLGIHVINSFLVFFLSQKLQKDIRISYLSALIYLGFYPHFEATIWAFNFQHLSVTFFILLVFIFYLWVEEKKDLGVPCKFLYCVTLFLNFLATFSRITIVILPAIIFTHILSSNQNSKEKTQRYLRWLPLFASYLLYPLFFMVSEGDDQLKILMQFGTSSSLLAYIIFFVLGLLLLYLFKYPLLFLDSCFRGNDIGSSLSRKGFNLLFLIFFLFIFFVLLVYKDIRNFALPYNYLVPLVTLLKGFFIPFQSSLESFLILDSIKEGYLISGHVGFGEYILGFIFIILCGYFYNFRKGFVPVFIVWYTLPFFYLNLYTNILSRYLIYISPLVCIFISLFLVSLFDLLFKKKSYLKYTVVFVVLILVFQNIVGIRYHLFKSKMVKNFPLYTYIKTSYKMVEDSKINNKDFSESNAVGLDEFPHQDFVNFDREKNINFKLVLEQVKQSSQDRLWQGSNAFDEAFDLGLRAFHQNKYDEAKKYFQKAIQLRPFFINYVLSQYSLEDSVWVTGGEDLRTWIHKITDYYVSVQEGEMRNVTDKYMRKIELQIEEEIQKYGQSFFYLSYLTHLEGKEEVSLEYFSKIKYFASSPYNLIFRHCERGEAISSLCDGFSVIPKIPASAGMTRSVIPAQAGIQKFLSIVQSDTNYSLSWYSMGRDRLPTGFHFFLFKFITCGKFNQFIEGKLSDYLKRNKKEREKAFVLPH